MKQYLTKAEAAEEFQCSPDTIDRAVKEIQKYHIGPGKRYGQYSFRGDGRIFQIRYAVLTDFMRYREFLRDKVAAKAVPAFDVKEAERDLGVIRENGAVAQVDADEIVDAIFARFRQVFTV